MEWFSVESCGLNMTTWNSTTEAWNSQFASWNQISDPNPPEPPVTPPVLPQKVTWTKVQKVPYSSAE